MDRRYLNNIYRDEADVYVPKLQHAPIRSRPSPVPQWPRRGRNMGGLRNNRSQFTDLRDIIQNRRRDQNEFRRFENMNEPFYGNREPFPNRLLAESYFSSGQYFDQNPNPRYDRMDNSVGFADNSYDDNSYSDEDLYERHDPYSYSAVDPVNVRRPERIPYPYSTGDRGYARRQESNIGSFPTNGLFKGRRHENITNSFRTGGRRQETAPDSFGNRRHQVSFQGSTPTVGPNNGRRQETVPDPFLSMEMVWPEKDGDGDNRDQNGMRDEPSYYRNSAATLYRDTYGSRRDANSGRPNDAYINRSANERPFGDRNTPQRERFPAPRFVQRSTAPPVVDLTADDEDARIEAQRAKRMNTTANTRSRCTSVPPAEVSRSAISLRNQSTVALPQNGRNNPFRSSPSRREIDAEQERRSRMRRSSSVGPRKQVGLYW